MLSSRFPLIDDFFRTSSSPLTNESNNPFNDPFFQSVRAPQSHQESSHLTSTAHPTSTIGSNAPLNTSNNSNKKNIKEEKEKEKAKDKEEDEKKMAAATTPSPQTTTAATSVDHSSSQPPSHDVGGRDVVPSLAGSSHWLLPSWGHLDHWGLMGPSWLDHRRRQTRMDRLFEDEFIEMDRMFRQLHRMRDRMEREVEQIRLQPPSSQQQQQQQQQLQQQQQQLQQQQHGSDGPLSSSTSSSYSSSSFTHTDIDGKSHSQTVRSECRRLGDLMEESTSFIDSNGNQRTTTKRGIGRDQLQQVTIDRNAQGQVRKFEDLHGIRQDEVEAFQKRWQEETEKVDPHKKLFGRIDGGDGSVRGIGPGTTQQPQQQQLTSSSESAKNDQPSSLLKEKENVKDKDHHHKDGHHTKQGQLKH